MIAWPTLLVAQRPVAVERKAMECTHSVMSGAGDITFWTNSLGLSVEQRGEFTQNMVQPCRLS